MVRIVFPRIARSFDLTLTLDDTADVEAEVRAFAARFLRSPEFAVTIDGDHVLISSLRTVAGPEAGDFGHGHITRLDDGGGAR